MTEAPITSTFVSHIAPVGFADAVDAADRLAGTEIAVGDARLEVKERIGSGLAGAVWYEGVVKTGSAFFPTVRVDIVVSPWSAGRTEIGLRPLSRIGRPDSFRANRFFDAAWGVLPRLAAAVTAGRTAEAPVHADLQVAA
jgi:hypothetical protein